MFWLQGWEEVAASLRIPAAFLDRKCNDYILPLLAPAAPTTAAAIGPTPE